MERSPIKDIEIKHILKNALTDKINGREVYMKGIDNSSCYECYAAYKTEELKSPQGEAFICLLLEEKVPRNEADEVLQISNTNSFFS